MALRAVAVVSALYVALTMTTGSAGVRNPHLVAGPMAWLLNASTDLGPAHRDGISLAVSLRHPMHPDALTGWTQRHHLDLQWQPGADWAYIEGTPAALGSALDVAIHDYRSRSGEVFYAAAQQPSIPTSLTAEVRELGTILGYQLMHRALPPNIPVDVPRGGLKPPALLRTYNAEPLVRDGFTGKGQTVVFFEIDGFKQGDLDQWADKLGSPRFTPVLIGGQPGKVLGETEMDLEVVHAIVPDAKLVVVNALAFGGSTSYAQAGQMYQLADRQFPGAVWSTSLGIGCDRMATAADLAPVESAVQIAESHGTSAFMSSGDSGGLECADFNGDWSTPPGEKDQGINAVGSVPAMTDVGGTTLSTDANGVWVSEASWFDSPMSQGTGGGVSRLFPRPSWQSTVSSAWDSTHRLTPDVAADADPYSGVSILIDGHWMAGGGTSQSAPIWAGLTVLINQFLAANGGQPVGNINPVLYQVAASATRPAFHDVVTGGNAVHIAVPGYDLVTGLGTPDTDSLAHDILDIQKGARQ
ncbi:S53 family peptidase [Mycobacterium paraterrae]|uniref:S53 family peptidase n=1 Tax=Mycobacterium paraterrae TaxID=577492 RepID=A0ABY3VJ56_9MYCO|nr:S53 family peptidase [Mycobacterium paraterrae]UMB67462.1 S53 family peptidase [Mycobacterium paraterrae]